ncbi:alpha/beta fold hydrolase [Duganella sp. P38]|uniref:alpha/beta fold hydrolase n=1 Tax=Duganella sp. P38 TaxID=3423949 RepID=UPI003D7A262E
MTTHTPSRSEFLTIRGLRCHVRHWGREGAPKLFMLHGWMDVGASFQFVVDALEGDWHVIAPDWRGFGLSQRSGLDTYWFPDYLADLDAILRHYSPDQAVYLLGHSMGGNIVGLYAGARPERIRKLINLEGAGLKGAKPEQTPGRYAKWLDSLLEQPEMRSYPTQAAVAARLQNQPAPERRQGRLPGAALVGAERGRRMGNPRRPGAQAGRPAAVSRRRRHGLLAGDHRAGAVGGGRPDQYVGLDGRQAGRPRRTGAPPRPPARRHPQNGRRRRPHVAP